MKMSSELSRLVRELEHIATGIHFLSTSLEYLVELIDRELEKIGGEDQRRKARAEINRDRLKAIIRESRELVRTIHYVLGCLHELL